MNLPDETHSAPGPSLASRVIEILRRYRLVLTLLAVCLLFLYYVDNVSTNPPGFYIDESAISYNAYCLAQTGAGEFGDRFPLFFPVYTSGWIQYANPTQIYLLAIPFSIVQPSIRVARVYSATWVFAACVLLGLLATRISGQRRIGAIVGLTAIFTPWMFEVSRLVMETFFYPMALVLFLLAVYHAQRKQNWSWVTAGAVAATLMLLTYTYTIGRLLGPLMAVGLVLFVTSRPRLISVIKTWILYGLTLVPLLIYNAKNPERLTQRFYLISYIKQDSPWSEIAPKFIRRYLEDFSLISLLIDGDGNPRHHVQGSLGSFLVAAFILAMIGLLVVIVRHWREPWWRFVIFGAAVSIVPGALNAEQFHSLRIIGYPVFLLLLMIPALIFLFERPSEVAGDGHEEKELQAQSANASLPTLTRQTILAVLLVGIALQAAYFQRVFRSEGPDRGYVFDSAYKDIFDAATALPNRPIYLSDGIQPSYEHAYWYALVEGRNHDEFIHLDEGTRAPAGTIVISSERQCVYCDIIRKNGDYMVYRAL